jgi:glycosyltransferase involved in cell wall biosynthesis
VIGFTGDMSYFPNQEAVTFFAGKVLPLIRRSVPEARFVIVGRSPNPAVEALAKQPGVEVTGFVPDVRTHLARMTVSVAPFSIAAGIQNKILEAMSYELPVVATARAVQGLTPAAAVAVQTAETPETISAAVVRLLLDPDLARERGRQGRELITGEYNWERSLDRVLQLIENPAERQSRRAELSPLS